MWRERARAASAIVLVDMALPPPTDLGPYQATRLLSSGAQSTVWLADSPHGEVAVKVARGESNVAALKREIELIRSAPPAGLIELIDADPSGRWMAMERVRGALIAPWSDGRTESEIIPVVRQLLRQLGALHQAGIVHGDIKPSNLMVDHQGNPRILDLGVAAIESDDRKEFRGTLGYAAPEVLRGEPISARSDLYGVGAVIYRCLTQHDPFEADDPSALAYLPMVTLPLPPSSWHPGLSRRLEHIVLTLLSRDPSRRPASAERVADALDDQVDREPARWALGMRRERDRLARAVVRAADGETQVVCVYGIPGSGRRTLITEATQAARRLGLTSLHLDELDEAFFKTALDNARPFVVVGRARQRRAIEVSRAILKLHIPGLVLLHSERPVPTLGDQAMHLSPQPLEPADVARLARHLRADPALAEEAWSAWRGNPAAILGALRISLPETDPSRTDHLPAESRQILDHLNQHGTCPTLALADSFRIDAHTLLDHCAVLLAEQRIEVVENGEALRPVPLGGGFG